MCCYLLFNLSVLQKTHSKSINSGKKEARAEELRRLGVHIQGQENFCRHAHLLNHRHRLT